MKLRWITVPSAALALGFGCGMSTAPNPFVPDGGGGRGGAEVGGNLNTHNGDIELTAGAHVRGGIIVKKSHDTGWSWGKDKPPQVRICSTCIVDGDLRFERPVDLKVETGAKIRKVIDESKSK